MPIDVHTGGSGWQEPSNIKVHNGAGWQNVQKVWVRNSTGWVPIWIAEVTEYFGVNTTNGYYGTTLDGAGFYGRTKNTSGDPRGAACPIGDLDAFGSGYLWNNRGMWRPATGSVSGAGFASTLSGRTITSFKLSFTLAMSFVSVYAGDGTPTNFTLWGIPWEYLPGDLTLTSSQAIFLTQISCYTTGSVTTGNVPVPASTFGTNPPSNGDRTPATAFNVELIGALSSSAKAALTDGGSINTFLLMAYNSSKTNLTGDANWQSVICGPGDDVSAYYGAGAVGHAQSLRITVTHTP